MFHSFERKPGTDSASPPIESHPHHRDRGLLLAAHVREALRQFGKDETAAIWEKELSLDRVLARDEEGYRLLKEAQDRRVEVGLEPTPSALPATARLLELLGEGEPALLRERVRWWLDQRLWSDNRVRELVIHDERHTQRVDLLCAQLLAPVMSRAYPLLDAEDAQVLSMAAWLHDWGHEGGIVDAAYIGGDSAIAAIEPEVVRDLHGVVTRELLRPEWEGRHGLPPDVASRVAILSAHHQGWTSFGSSTPSRTLTTTPPLVVTPPSLDADVAKHNHEFPRARVFLGKMQLMLAILRVADGADMGVHRVPDAGASKAAYLARGVQLQCRQALTALLDLDANERQKQDAAAAIGGVSALARQVGDDFGDGEGEEPARNLARQMTNDLAHFQHLVPVRRLCSYISLAARQAQYYAAHRAVGSVWFETKRVAPGSSTVTVWVAASEHAPNERAAVTTVEDDILRELRRGDHDGQVAETLAQAGLRLACVCSFGDEKVCSEAVAGIP